MPYRKEGGRGEGKGGGRWTGQICHILLIQEAERVKTTLLYAWSLKGVNKFGFGLRQKELPRSILF